MPGSISSLVIPDLSKDERFRNLPFVTGGHKWRFYAGSAIRTKTGVNLGSVCVLDDRPREGLSPSQSAFMSTISEIVMNHLEQIRETEERRKMVLMSRGLNAFMEGRSSLAHGEAEEISREAGDRLDPSANSPGSHRTKANPNHAPDANGAHELVEKHDDGKPHDQSQHVSDVHLQDRRPSGLIAIHSIRSDPSDESNDSFEGHGIDEDLERSQAALMSRAANLLREALDLQEDGGVVFLDASSTLRSGSDLLTAETIETAESENESEVDGLTVEDKVLGADQDSRCHQAPTEATYESEVAGQGILPCHARIIRLSVGDRSSAKEPDLKTSQAFLGIRQQLLQRLLRYYPRGKLWSFDSEGCLFLSDDEKGPPYPSRTRKPSRRDRTGWRAAEAKMLQEGFPGGVSI